MSEVNICSVTASVLLYDNETKRWNVAGKTDGPSKVQMYHHVSKNAFRIVAWKVQDREVVLNYNIPASLQYFKANSLFHQWMDGEYAYGISFTSATEADEFALSLQNSLEVIKRDASKTIPRPPPLTFDVNTSNAVGNGLLQSDNKPYCSPTDCSAVLRNPVTLQPPSSAMGNRRISPKVPTRQDTGDPSVPAVLRQKSADPSTYTSPSNANPNHGPGFPSTLQRQCSDGTPPTYLAGSNATTPRPVPPSPTKGSPSGSTALQKSGGAPETHSLPRKSCSVVSPPTGGASSAPSISTGPPAPPPPPPPPQIIKGGSGDPKSPRGRPTGGGLSAALQDAKLKQSKSLEAEGGPCAAVPKPKMSMMDEMAAKLKKRTAQPACPDKPKVNITENLTILAPKGNIGGRVSPNFVKTCNIPPTEKHTIPPKPTNTDSTKSIQDEIINAIRKDLQQMKNDIISGIKDEMAKNGIVRASFS